MQPLLACPRAKNVYRSPATVPIGYDFSYASVFSETPEIVVPLGQVAYESAVTRHTEYLPVTVGLMARTGCDYVVLDLVKALQVRSSPDVAFLV